MNAEQALEHYGIHLPEPPVPGGSYVPFRRIDTMVILAGTISSLSTGEELLGQVGAERTFEEGVEASTYCALNVLATLRSITGSLNDIEQFLYVGGYVNAVSGYGKSPSVINGASDLFLQLFGEAGKHARAAVAVAGLPKNATVELQVTVAYKDGVFASRLG